MRRFILTLLAVVFSASSAMAQGQAEFQSLPAIYLPNPMLPQGSSVFIEELTWVEIRDAIKAGKTTVIIPTAGNENNGPHMATGKHATLVRYKAGKAAQLLGDALVAPVMTYVPEGDIGKIVCCGYITTPEPIFIQVLEYAARSLKAWGFTDIAFVGDSGSNQKGQAAAAANLNKEFAGTNVRVHHISDYYPGRGDALAVQMGLTQEQVGGHAGSHDTSSFLYLNPLWLRIDKIPGPAAKNPGMGYSGDPSKTTPQIGKAVVEAQPWDAAKQIKELRVSSRK
jgi:creatinine amidohydrolase/Fe(II)-dependent formamide hydrolase-like protein